MYIPFLGISILDYVVAFGKLSKEDVLADLLSSLNAQALV